MDRMGSGCCRSGKSSPKEVRFLPILRAELLRVEPYLTRAHYSVLRQGSIHAAHIASSYPLPRLPSPMRCGEAPQSRRLRRVHFI